MDLLDALVRSADRAQRRLLGIWEFSDDPECLFRLSVSRAPAHAVLRDGTELAPGQRVAILHIWGEHFPRIADQGPDMAWAKVVQRRLTKSLRMVAIEFAHNPRLAGLPAFGNVASFHFTEGIYRLLERLGFDVLEPRPNHGLPSRLRRRLIQWWTWLLRRAHNPRSVALLGASDLQVRPVWMSRGTLFRLHLPPNTEA